MSALDIFFAACCCLIVLIGLVLYACRMFKRAAEAGPFRETRDALRLQIKALEEQIAEGHRTLADLGRQMDEMRVKIEQGKEIIAKAEKERLWLNENEQLLVYLRAEEAALKESVKSLTDKRNELDENVRKKHEELESEEKKLLNAREEQSHIANDLAVRRPELDAVKAQLEAARLALESIGKDLGPRREELERLKSEIAKLEGLKKELANLNEDITQKKKELAALDDLIAKKRPEAARIVEEANEKAAKTISSATERAAQTVNSANELADKIVSTARQNATLEAERTRNAALSGIVSDKKALEHEIDALIENKARLIAEVGELKHQAETVKNCWKELDLPVASITSGKYQRNRVDEHIWLESVKNALQKNGLIFDDRIVHAFHTGLKVADASPLVVLAGISGTGKSLLPQLYAHAAGMNFLPLAVQPRWDSPQDMLGFYNYMERRYKATELARLLWQYDIWNNEEARKAFGSVANLPMNLVLLDEMNIARVEYYFSDFLSKLELRRNINPADESSRRSAEIEIEGGLPTGADKTDGNLAAMVAWKSVRRLFPARNTLFIGTMNEDESTQSLSDKVIDRSNVIRFGRPAKLDAKSDAHGFMGSFQSERHMTYEDWRKWVKISNPDGVIGKQVFRIASDLNTQMEALGRPFGLRNVQAMLAYCENYPESGDKGFKLALADQIEMKVLPKLNGLEKDAPHVGDALDRIRDILSREIGTADAANGHAGLVDAFDTAKSPDTGVFFQWKGISR